MVLCLDGSSAFEVWDWQEMTAEPGPDLIVLTKADLGDVTRFLESLPPTAKVERLDEFAVQLRVDGRRSGDAPRRLELLRLSGRNGHGLASFRNRLAICLQAKFSAEESSLVASTATRCRASLEQAREAISRALDLVRVDQGHELIAADIREALDELGQVVGAVYTDEILDRIFSRFCIGK